MRDECEHGALRRSCDRCEMADEITELRSQVETLRASDRRYRWLADRVLACDYGDNDSQGDLVGWRIRHDLLSHGGRRQPAFMYGDSIDAAIDVEMKEKT